MNPITIVTPSALIQAEILSYKSKGKTASEIHKIYLDQGMDILFPSLIKIYNGGK